MMQSKNKVINQVPILNWLTRDDDIQATKKVPYRLLEEVPDLSYGDKDAGNMLIQGDNLEALKALLPFYAGQVKCIYIDPPYNTKSAFEHYDDNLEHTQWLAMMWPRLEVLRELLSEDGSIWVSIDDNEAHYLKVIMDEVFGRDNFVRNIVWQKKYTVASDSNGIPDSHDHILVFRRSNKMKRGLFPRSEKQNSLYKYDDNDGKGRYRTDNLSVKTYSADYDYKITNPNTGKKYDPPNGRCWMTSPARMEILLKDNSVFFGKNGTGGPQLKRYLNKVQQGVVPTSWWSHEESGHNDESRKEIKKLSDGDFFATPKPERLISRILQIATDKNDLILDSFLGSGTATAIAQKMERRYIGVEMGDHAVTHCQPRQVKVVDGEQGGISEAQNWKGGGGFRFYRLGANAFDEDGRICSDIRFSVLAAHVWFSETNTPWSGKGDSPALGIDDGKGYALLYNGILGDKRPDGGNVLTSQTLKIIRDELSKIDEGFTGSIVIYGESSRMGGARLKRENVIFKQTPYDVKAR